MTNIPEIRLAREAELGYATIAMVNDYDCWHKSHDSSKKVRQANQIPAIIYGDGIKPEPISLAIPELRVDLLAYYIQEKLRNTKVKITKLAQGLPVGGEIESLDDGTLFSAFKNRSKLNSNLG